MSLHELVQDLFTYTCSKLDLYDIQSLSYVCHDLHRRCNHPTIWRQLCLSDFGIQSLDAFPKTNIVEVTKADFEAENTESGNMEKSWKNFFQLMHCSEVYSWGAGSRGRLGHGNDDTVKNPKFVSGLSGKSVKFLGKTAEVGSCAFSFSGKKFFLWGSREGSSTPKTYNVSDYSPEPGDHVVHISCGHDSGFLIVLDSGRVISRTSYSGNALVCTSDYLLESHLLPSEKPIWSIGSQSGMSGVVTNMNRVIAWRTDAGNRFVESQRTKPPPAEKEAESLEKIEKTEKLEEEPKPVFPCFVVPPIDKTTGERFLVKKAAFGHRHWFAIGPSHQLYWIPLSTFPYRYENLPNNELELNLWTSVPGTLNLNIIDVDSGSDHSGFITDTGDVYTWGIGSHGCLGHGSLDNEKVPRKVDYFSQNNLKAVAIGCGGHISWSGGFTLVLVEDNRLFYSGRLGDSTHQMLPTQVIIPDRLILSISAGEDWAGIVTCRTLTGTTNTRSDTLKKETDEVPLHTGFDLY